MISARRIPQALVDGPTRARESVGHCLSKRRRVHSGWKDTREPAVITPGVDHGDRRRRSGV